MNTQGTPRSFFGAITPQCLIDEDAHTARMPAFKQGDTIKEIDAIPWRGMVCTFKVCRVFWDDYEDKWRVEAFGLGQRYLFDADMMEVA